jgi:hypothetical protein
MREVPGSSPGNRLFFCFFGPLEGVLAARESIDVLGIALHACVVAREEQCHRSGCSGSGSVSRTAWLYLEEQDSSSDVKKICSHRSRSEESKIASSRFATGSCCDATALASESAILTFSLCANTARIGGNVV